MPQKTAYKFNVPYLSVLNEKGGVDAKLDPELDDRQLVSLYRAMVHAREADQRMLRLQRQGRMGTFSPSTGQEAAACGPALALKEADWLVPAFRELGALLMRGVPLHRVLLFWGGFEEGNVFDPASKTLPIAVIVASQIPHAAGMAYAMKYRGGDGAVLCFFGDGATSEGDFMEGLNFAAVWKAPVVFVCQNNQWAISTPLDKQTASETIAQKAAVAGIPGIQVDGNDPLAMYKATHDALERARAGEGPTLVEALTYRLLMHTTADDPTKYRDSKDVDVWEKRDPLVRMRKLLDKRQLWSDEEETALKEEIKKRIDSEVRTYEKGVDAKKDIMFDHVVGTEHPELERQRAEFMARIGGEEAGDDA
jgi:pyruvate dehydrogenase E1 component alpha subunit